MVPSRIFPLFATFLLCLLAACQSPIIDLTGSQLKANPSGLYTFSFRADLAHGAIVEDSLRATIVINGQSYEMQPSGQVENVFVFDYAMPPGLNVARYYYVIEYRYRDSEGRERSAREDSLAANNGEVYVARLANRYVSELDPARGPVGARISILGRGFSEFDRVVFGGQEVDTHFEFPGAVSFVVPSREAGRDYSVAVRTDQGDLSAGIFRIDPARLTVLPPLLRLGEGQQQTVLFRIEFDAPPEGLPIDVKTDVPGSVIMPEVRIAPGERTVNIQVEGGASGQGILQVTAPGFVPVEVPVTVE